MKLSLPTIVGASVAYLATFSSAEAIYNLPVGSFPLISSEIQGNPYSSNYSFGDGTFENLIANILVEINVVPSSEDYVLLGFRAKDHTHDISSTLCAKNGFEEYRVYYNYTANAKSNNVNKRDTYICVEDVDVVSTWQNANGTNFIVDAGTISGACFDTGSTGITPSSLSSLPSNYSPASNALTFTFTLTEPSESVFISGGHTYTTTIQVTEYVTTCPSQVMPSATVSGAIESSPTTYTFSHEYMYVEGTKILTSTVVLTTCPACANAHNGIIASATSAPNPNLYNSNSKVLSKSSAIENIQQASPSSNKATSILQASEASSVKDAMRTSIFGLACLSIVMSFLF